MAFGEKISRRRLRKKIEFESNRNQRPKRIVYYKSTTSGPVDQSTTTSTENVVPRHPRHPNPRHPRHPRHPRSPDMEHRGAKTMERSHCHLVQFPIFPDTFLAENLHARPSTKTIHFVFCTALYKKSINQSPPRRNTYENQSSGPSTR